MGHTVPHDPQLAVSLLRFAQVVPQYVVPPGHPHTPPTHDWPVGHTRPHDPQLLRSVAVLTHAPPQ